MIDGGQCIYTRIRGGAGISEIFFYLAFHMRGGYPFVGSARCQGRFQPHRKTRVGESLSALPKGN